MKYACKKDAGIRVQDLAVLMLNVRFSTIYQFAYAAKVIPVIHSVNVAYNHHEVRLIFKSASNLFLSTVFECFININI